MTSGKMNSIPTAAKWQRLQRHHSFTLKDSRIQNRRGRGEPHPRGRMATDTVLSAIFFFFLKRNHMDQKATGEKESNNGADSFSVCSRFLENNRVLLHYRKTGRLAGVLWQKSEKGAGLLLIFKVIFLSSFANCYLIFCGSISLNSQAQNLDMS